MDATQQALQDALSRQIVGFTPQEMVFAGIVITVVGFALAGILLFAFRKTLRRMWYNLTK